MNAIAERNSVEELQIKNEEKKSQKENKDERLQFKRKKIS